jgi:hypothetical protein
MKPATRTAILAAMCAGLIVAGGVAAASKPPGVSKAGAVEKIVAVASERLDAKTPKVPAPVADAAWPFTIDLPEGWTGGETPDHDYDAGRSWRFADDDGSFFVVNIDPAGSCFDADAVWSYGTRGANEEEFFVVEKGPMCPEGEAMCMAGDGKLDIMGSTYHELFPVRGHVYYFHFGNTGDERAATRVFETILESIRAR